ncbi:MAG: 2-amino-4-hydroxy-6-hydroxymethyldihydropteridine diphosphokinase [Gammaproteobacteria bacterium]|nr:2-amino-4-hydroxy-6-hydroxymethyldihydropteridine diphosphokinase [Gammaproteobacteria bacterium]MBI5618954.1 2-amino-4-hydroxy-6-hydroxymethyldihydropteridine diphosphokinase [Gammaproteobacteria bacterium]
MDQRVRVYLGLGSNIDAGRHLRGAVSRLEAAFGRLSVSRVCRTPAVGFAGADFYNLAVGLDTERDLDELTTILRGIEEAEGRARGGAKFAPRTLDIDVLTYGALVRQDKPMLPRADILEYAFVLGPLADIASAECHPVLGVPYGALWAAFEGAREEFEWIENFWE